MGRVWNYTKNQSLASPSTGAWTGFLGMSKTWQPVCTCLLEETNAHTSVHSSNTGKLWNYTRNQNLSSPRGGCRAGIQTCFHLFKHVKQDMCPKSDDYSSARVRVHVHVCLGTKRDSRTEVRGSVCACLFVETNTHRCILKQHWWALELYEKSEFVFAEKWMSCRNNNGLFRCILFGILFN